MRRPTPDDECNRDFSNTYVVSFSHVIIELSLIGNAGRQMKGTRLLVGNENMIEKH